MSSRGRRPYRWLLSVVAALAGGSIEMGCAAYGSPVVIHDPQVRVADFSYIPAVKAQPGDELTFTVTLNHAARPGYPGHPQVQIGSVFHGIAGSPPIPYIYIALHDDGIFPDAVAGDNIWTSVYTLPADLPAQTGLPVKAYYGKCERGALDLEILPKEE